MTIHSPALSEDELRIVDPHDGVVMGTLPLTPQGVIRELLDDARRAVPSWRTRSAEERGSLLTELAHQLSEHEAELADIQHRETGRDRHEAISGVRAAAATLMQYAQLGPVHRGRSLLGASTAIDIMRPEPRGVAVVLTPWNDPVAVSAGLIGAALVTGNTVIHKPSERCPHLGQLIGDIYSDILPAGVFATVIGGPREGETLVSSHEVDLVAHVGSTSAGESIARAVAATGAHLIRENGGNDAMIVDADVDPVWAAEQAAIGAFTNSGQLCTAVERLFVHRAVVDEFVAALTAEAEARTADGRIAPLVDQRMRKTVHGHVEGAVSAGAVLRTGGDIPPGAGCRYPATVLTDCTPAMAVFAEETFGPVAPVMVVDDFDEGLREAADDEYGLAATVLTACIGTAHRAIDALPVGTVKINEVFGGAPGGAAQPRGRSGSGYGFGPELLDEMTTTKVVHMSEAVRR